MNLVEQYKAHVNADSLFRPGQLLILAVSGGLDSMVLISLCRAAGYRFVLAHCNFQLRGEESQRDEDFIRQYAAQTGFTYHVKRFDTAAAAKAASVSIQEMARQQRYTWFAELAAELRAAETPAQEVLVLTAHHADDNVETLLMHFFRGTGLNGLTGIPPRNGIIRRPLLPFSREELQEYAIENQLQWVEDSSNASEKYTRNFMRHSIIPALREKYPTLQENMLHSIERFRSIAALHSQLVDEKLSKICSVKGKEIWVPVRLLLKNENRGLIYELITRHGFSEKQVGEVIKLAKAGSGRYLIAANSDKRLIRHRHWFIICPSETTGAHHIVIEKQVHQIVFPGGTLRISHRQSAGITDDAGIALLDLSKIEYPLLLRKWKTGDYFYPLGMMKKKKIARFLIDQKRSKTQKENTWVLESAQRIIWVVGERIDNRFKLPANATEALEIIFSPAVLV